MLRQRSEVRSIWKNGTLILSDLDSVVYLKTFLFSRMFCGLNKLCVDKPSLLMDWTPMTVIFTTSIVFPAFHKWEFLIECILHYILNLYSFVVYPKTYLLLLCCQIDGWIDVCILLIPPEKKTNHSHLTKRLGRSFFLTNSYFRVYSQSLIVHLITEKDLCQV